MAVKVVVILRVRVEEEEERSCMKGLLRRWSSLRDSLIGERSPHSTTATKQTAAVSSPVSSLIGTVRCLLLEESLRKSR
jgi:hypothetical protein